MFHVGEFQEVPSTKRCPVVCDTLNKVGVLLHSVPEFFEEFFPEVEIKEFS